MDKITKIKNLNCMVEDLQDRDLDAVYHLVWSLTAKDLIIKIDQKCGESNGRD
jgi:hypothetical protein